MLSSINTEREGESQDETSELTGDTGSDGSSRCEAAQGSVNPLTDKNRGSLWIVAMRLWGHIS